MAGAIACLFAGANQARWIALLATLADLALGVILWMNFDQSGAAAQWQFQEYAPIFGRFAWALGIDGIALLLIALTVFLLPICIGASWIAIAKRVPEYMAARSAEHTSELQSLMRISYAVFCLKNKTTNTNYQKKHK